MLQSLIKAHIAVLEKASKKKPVVFVFKGFPVHFLQNLNEQLPHINTLNFVNGEKSLDLIKIKEATSSLPEKIKKSSAKKTFLLYEEFLLIPSETINTMPFIFKIIVNNFFDYYPNQAQQAFPDIEDTINHDLPLEENDLYDLFYSDSTYIANTNCIQYLDYERNEKTDIEEINFFDPSSVTLPAYKDNPSKAKDLIQFRASDGSYHKLTFDLFNNMIPKTVNLVVNENIDHITSDLGELKILYYLLSTAGCDVNLYRQKKEFTDHWRPELQQLLKKHWNKEAEFKKLKIYREPAATREMVEYSQGSIIEHIVKQVELAREGKLFEDIFLTAPTGAGKSLLFQLPAIYLTNERNHKSVTVVISPLKSLMADQVWALENDRHFSEVAFLNSDLSLVERQKLIDRIMSEEISLVYMSPELLLAYGIETFIGGRELGLLVIDEAHLVTTWGRDFRVDYWFLGNYIRTLRRSATRDLKEKKIKTYRFPVVALTATAVHTGEDDMVFETISSLNMQNCCIYIGKIRREEISFKYQPLQVESHDEEKLHKTKERIEEFILSGRKAIFYFPWIKHIEQVMLKLDRKIRPLVRKYHSDLPADERSETLTQFKSGDTKAVLATKAFGMGVDISDIQIVYHHAPAGSLADYVQEIGRVARQKGIKGTAMVDYNSFDLKYTKVLFGMSSLKQYQLGLTLKKLHGLYKVKQDKNMLISTYDFRYIFARDEYEDAEQKIRTALLVLEKDLQARFGYNVMMVRPQTFFAIAYGSVPAEDYPALKKKYGNFIEEVQKQAYARKAAKFKGGAYVLREEKEDMKFMKIYLDRIWQKHFPQESFQTTKRNFFKKQLLPGVEPYLKVQLHFNDSITNTQKKIETAMAIVGAIISTFEEKPFTKIALISKLKEKIKKESVCRKIANLLTGYYSQMSDFGAKGGLNFTGGNFLVKTRKGGKVFYKMSDSAFLHGRSQMMRMFQLQFDGIDESERKYVDFFPLGSDKTNEKLKLHYFLETFELATYEITGVESPQIFVRLNDPRKLETLSREEYTNNIVSGTERRHRASMEIMNYFFRHDMDDDERWNYIEDYFLGKEVRREMEVEEEEDAVEE